MSRIPLTTNEEGLELIMIVSKMRGQVVQCFVLVMVKYTRIYFFRANDAPCFLAHSKHRL